MCVSIYICICMCVYIYIYMHVYRERERERCCIYRCMKPLPRGGGPAGQARQGAGALAGALY